MHNMVFYCLRKLSISFAISNLCFLPTVAYINNLSVYRCPLDILRILFITFERLITIEAGGLDELVTVV